MTKAKKGIITKCVGGVFNVEDGAGCKYVCFSPKKLRYKSDDAIIGDNVLFSEQRNGKGLIEEVLPRKNKLTRPEIANVDVCFLVLACEPLPDFYLADKVLINCFQAGIEPIIVVNKNDLTDETLKRVKENYGRIAEIIGVSAMNDTAMQLKRFLADGKIACFAGQSAVGKTSLLNAILPDVNGKTGGISEKSGRGTHTTRHASLHRINGGYIADTCGFSLCELTGIRSDELRLYLDDFMEVARGCKYSSCTHTVEPDCSVIEAVNSGVLCKERYDRYVEEYGELKEAEKKQY